jgi:hypothetical protein
MIGVIVVQVTKPAAGAAHGPGEQESK